MIGGLGMGEMILIFLVVLLLFGAKRLPEIGSSLGKGIREFKNSVREIEGELKTSLDEPERRVVPPPAPTVTAEETGGPRRLTTSEEPVRSLDEEPRTMPDEARKIPDEQ